MLKKKLSVAVALAMLVMSCITGCNGLDNYSVSPNHLLAFSDDTVAFDTVFTTVGSATNYFMIYNRNSQALKIEKIMLSGGSQSPFRINVDGRKGSVFNDIPVWGNDSLYVAVEVTVNPNDLETPFVIYDSIIFITNGNVQSVLLEAYGQNAVIFRGGHTFDEDVTLSASKPYLVYDSVVVSEGVNVTIDPGASFYMHSNSRWLIYGSIQAKGTQDHPVTFRGDRLGNYSSTISYDRISAQWDGMYFGASSFDNELSYTVIRNGISGLFFDESTPDRKKISISNSRITNMDGNVILAVNCYIEAYNSEFSNASEYLVLLAGGKSQFIHCTLVNYMPAALMSTTSVRLNESLIVSDNIIYVDQDGNQERYDYHVIQAYFDNCIIDGSLTVDSTKEHGSEIFFSTDTKYLNGDDEHFNYRFNHCYMKTVRLSGERFIDNLYGESPVYLKNKPYNDDDKPDFIYDFRLADKSVGIGKADPAISALYPVDMYGVNRLSGTTAPSIGAYEYVPQK